MTLKERMLKTVDRILQLSALPQHSIVLIYGAYEDNGLWTKGSDDRWFTFEKVGSSNGYRTSKELGELASDVKRVALVPWVAAVAAEAKLAMPSPEGDNQKLEDAPP